MPLTVFLFVELLSCFLFFVMKNTVPTDIKTCQVKTTIVDGRVVYDMELSSAQAAVASVVTVATTLVALTVLV